MVLGGGGPWLTVIWDTVGISVFVQDALKDVGYHLTEVFVVGDRGEVVEEILCPFPEIKNHNLF